MLQVQLKKSLTLDQINKLVNMLYGTTRVEFINGNINDFRECNIKVLS